MNNCLFCAIANGDKEKLVWENDTLAAFPDIHPKAPVHILLVPKRHIEKLDDLDDVALAGELLARIKVIAAQQGIAGAYRVQINNGRAGGQVIDHLHIHILGGRQFKE